MDRHWFPAITLGFTILLILVFAVALSPRGREALQPDRDVREVTSQTPAVSEESYQTAVGSIIETYKSTNDAEAAYDALILLRVPASMMNVHYELVIAMQKESSGNEAEATARFAALKAQYSWLNLE